MPQKKIGEGNVARWNKKQPVLSFRAPDPDFKDRVRDAAKVEGVSVQEYLRRAVTAYMDGVIDMPETTKAGATKSKTDPDTIRALMEAEAYEKKGG